jgi:xylan 1,4-beta-xylosidase
LGRETFLAPMVWTNDGWPVIGNNGTIEIEMEADLPTPHPSPPEPIRDDFDKPTLGSQWNTLRNAPQNAWSLSESQGSLTLHGNAATLNDLAAPAFVGRRQTHWDVAVRTQLSFAPTNDGEESGLTIFYQNEYHYEIAILCRDGAARLIVRRRIGDLTAIVADTPAPTQPIVLVVKADKLQYQMGYECDREFVHLATGSTQHLSCEAAPVGFTGVYFAVYATGNGKPAQAASRFAWFDYEPSPV